MTRERERERERETWRESRIILDPRRSSVYKETRAARDSKFQVSKEAHTYMRIYPYVLRITPPSPSHSDSRSDGPRDAMRPLIFQRE